LKKLVKQKNKALLQAKNLKLRSQKPKLLSFNYHISYVA
jgi:hypothetical protein